MTSRRMANQISPLLDLIERRFGLRVPASSVDHLKSMSEHYMAKRRMLMWEHGPDGVLSRDDYAKAVLISEAANLMLREIDPWPRRKKKKGNHHG